MRHPASFRDPSGSVFVCGERMLRSIRSSALAEWQDVLGTGLLDTLQRRRAIPETRPIDIEELQRATGAFAAAAALEHERVPFVSYPYEWSFGMLKAAALLHLEVLDTCLAHGFVTKDGTSYNVQFIGVRPVFVDVLSFVRQRAGAPWTGYRQFCRLFLFPLMLSAYRGIAFRPWLRGDGEGLDVLDVRRLFGWSDVWKPGVLFNVLLHARLEETFASSPRRPVAEIAGMAGSRDVVRPVLRQLRKVVMRLEPKRRSSGWSGYLETCSYTDADLAVKRDFVEAAVAESRPRMLWDIGCNTGEYTEIAARHCGYVVALDSDEACIEHMHSRLIASGITNVLPLVASIVDPSPGQGWRLTERTSLFERGRPDMILVLGLLHHLAIGSSIPLHEIVGWLATSCESAVIEFVDPDDGAAQTLLTNRGDGGPDYSADHFEATLARHFTVVQETTLPMKTRRLYHVRAA